MGHTNGNGNGNGKYNGNYRNLREMPIEGQEEQQGGIPQSVQSEQALLGSILIDPETYVLVSDIVRPDHFYRDCHQQIYKVFEHIVEQEAMPDYLSVGEELERRNIRLRHDESNYSYLTGLINSTPSSGNAETYARVVEDTAVRRRLMFGAGEIAGSAQADTAEEALAKAEEVIYSINNQRNVTSGYSGIGDVMNSCAEWMQKAIENKSSVIGIPTGLTDLDKLLKGLQKQFLYILAARPAAGKTAMALSMAYKMASKGQKVAVFSLEMGKDELGFRLISQQAGIPSDRLKAGFFDYDEKAKIAEAMGVIGESDLMIDDTGNISISQLRNRCRMMKARVGLDVIIIDYLQLMYATQRDGKSIENRVQEIGTISRGLKALAKELDVPVLALAQLSRAVELRQSKVPQLSDLRDSGEIEQDADVVMFIYRDEVYNPESERRGTADIIVAKNRHGPIGEVSLSFNASLTRFADLEVGYDRQ